MSSCIILTIVLTLCAFCTATFESSRLKRAVETDIDNDKVESIRREFLKNLSYSKFVHPCKNPYLNTCSNEKYSEKSMQKISNSVRTHLMGILNSSPSEHEIAPLSVEKKLYQKCLNLGKKENEEEKLETKRFVEHVFYSTMNPENSWQQVDRDSYHLGLGHAFFVVKTEYDPENPKSRIISLQPPPFEHIRQLNTLIEDALDGDPTNFDRERNYVWSIYRLLAKKNRKSIIPFFDQWKKMFSNAISSNTYSKNQVVKMTIHEWQVHYDSYSKNDTKIRWLNVFKDVFNKVKIEVNSTDSILIKNTDYFLFLSDLLSRVPNEVIVSVMRAKFMTENLRYIDWQKADSLSHQKRSKFCFEDTKLYGLSFRFIRDLRKTESANIPHHNVIESVIKHVVNSVISEITHSHELLSSEKVYLESQVHRITSYIFNFKHYREYVSNYYEDFQFSPSYFVSILNYKKMIEKHELDLMNIKPEYPQRELIPFSINDARIPHNRFMLYVYLSMNMHISNNTPKEIIYGAYGSKIAGFLYSLLNENRFHDDVLEHKTSDWSAHPISPQDTLECLILEKLEAYGLKLANTALTELVGVKLAHKALLRDLEHSNDTSYITRALDEDVNVDKLYLTAYMKYHCDLDEKVFNTVLHNLPLFDHVYGCNKHTENAISECNLNAFEFQEKSIFSSKS